VVLLCATDAFHPLSLSSDSSRAVTCSISEVVNRGVVRKFGWGGAFFFTKFPDCIEGTQSVVCNIRPRPISTQLFFLHQAQILNGYQLVEGGRDPVWLANFSFGGVRTPPPSPWVATSLAVRILWIVFFVVELSSAAYRYAQERSCKYFSSVQSVDHHSFITWLSDRNHWLWHTRIWKQCLKATSRKFAITKVKCAESLYGNHCSVHDVMIMEVFFNMHW